MPLTTVAVTPSGAYPALRDAIAAAKGGEVLAPVTVVVPTNAAGVTARRWLGRHVGVAGVDMLTLGRVAEVLAGPALAEAGRRPVSTPVIELALAAVLKERPGMYAKVAEHPSTVVALGELHHELRLAGAGALGALRESSRRGAAAADISAALGARLARDWYDSADLLAHAAARAASGELPDRLRRIVVFLPHPPRGLDADLLVALGSQAAVTVLLPLTGVASVDREMHAVAERLGASLGPPAAPRAEPSGVEIVSATDADEEVRHAVRTVIDAARAGTQFDRIAILWPSNEPYARLVEQHLSTAGLPWNGRPGTLATERIVPRFVLDLLAVDHRGLRRNDLFDLLADLDVRSSDGGRIPLARWERVARRAGVAGAGDWGPRLARYAAGERARAIDSGYESSYRADDAEALAAYVAELQLALGPRGRTRTWAAWGDWAVQQILQRLGLTFLNRLAEAERLAWDHTTRVLDRLRSLDEISGPVTRAQFRAVFEAEFDAAPGRLGRIGEGVTVGGLSGSVGIDVDLAIVLGAADGSMPPAPTPGPLIGDLDRQRAGLHPSDATAWRMHRQFAALTGSAARTVVLYPRGDLRGTSQRHPSRWLEPWLSAAPANHLPSHHAALLGTLFPAHAGEHRLRARLAAPSAEAGGDAVLAASWRLRAARRSEAITEFDGDLTGVPIEHFAEPVAPTQIEAWVACPHGYFMNYLLKVRPVDDPQAETEIPAFERGNLLHEVLDRLHAEVIAGLLPQPTGGWVEVHRRRGLELFERVADEFEAGGRTGRAASWRVERADLRRDLIGWFERDGARLAADGALIVASEGAFGDAGDVHLVLPDGTKLAVKGRIDRVHRTSSGELVVLDHKSGSKSRYAGIAHDDPTAGGTKFQLPVYAAGARSAAGVGATVGAYYAFFAKESYRHIGYRLDASVDAEVAVRLGHVVSGIRAGLFVARPDAPAARSPFVACWYCEPDGLGTAERYPEWGRKRNDPRGARWFAEPADDADADAEAGGEAA
jgi:ATP-dependent helicase/nuclease subunit B